MRSFVIKQSSENVAWIRRDTEKIQEPWNHGRKNNRVGGGVREGNKKERLGGTGNRKGSRRK